MSQITIFPGSMEAIGQALDIFGEKHVHIGEWRDPIYINDLTMEDVAYAKKFFGKIGCEVKEV